jgi:hypothetical protein
MSCWAASTAMMMTTTTTTMGWRNSQSIPEDQILEVPSLR